MNWPEIALEEAVIFRGGGTPSKQKTPFWSGDIPWVSPKDMSNRDLFDTIDHITPEAVASSATQIVPDNSVLVVVRSGILARKVPVAINRRSVALNQDLKALVPNPNLLVPDFLAYLLESRQSLLLSNYVKRGATVHSLHIDSLRKMRIPVPPLAEQRRIVEILDQADALRKKRAEADVKAGRILPALFHEMFGDRSSREGKLERDVLGNVLEKIDSGWSPTCETRPAEIHEWGVLKLGAVTTCEYIDTENKALPDDGSARDELEVKPGDLLFTRKNTYDLVGASAFVFKTRPRLMLSDLIFRFRLKPDKRVNPLFLWGLLTQPAKRKQIQALAGGSAGSMPNISKERLATLAIEIPALTTQEIFASRVVEILTLQEEQAEGRHRLDFLFSSLLHRTFSGNLTVRPQK